MIWQYQAGKGGVLGGIEWGSAVDAERAYFAVSDITQPAPGGLHAVVARDGGTRVDDAGARRLACGCGARVQRGTVRGAHGHSRRRVLRVGRWRACAHTRRRPGRCCGNSTPIARSRPSTVCPARGASMLGPGPAVAGGMLFVNSGYGAFLGRPGNVLLAFGPEPSTTRGPASVRADRSSRDLRLGPAT